MNKAIVHVMDRVDKACDGSFVIRSVDRAVFIADSFTKNSFLGRICSWRGPRLTDILGASVFFKFMVYKGRRKMEEE